MPQDPPSNALPETVDPTPDQSGPGASGHEDAAGPGEQGASSDASASEDAPVSSDEEYVAPAELPAWVITCTNCGTAIPFVPGIEGYEPSMGKGFSTCTGCDGFGEVKTGSQVAAHAIMSCPDCHGKGYFGPEGVQAATVVPVSEPPWQGATWNTELGTWT